MDSVKFFASGKPKGKGRPRFHNGHPYTDAQTRQYEYQIAANYRRIAGNFKFPDDVFLSVTVIQYMPIPKSTSKVKAANMKDGKIFPSAKPDLDNVIKAVLDALNGVAYKDDSKVVCIYSRKIYGENPGVMVTVSRM